MKFEDITRGEEYFLEDIFKLIDDLDGQKYRKIIAVDSELQTETLFLQYGGIIWEFHNTDIGYMAMDKYVSEPL